MAVHQSFILILAGLTGIYSIATVSKVSVKPGGSITIPCLYEFWYKNNVKYLCKGYYWSSCSYAIKTNQPDSGKFSISDDKSQRIFTVTIKDLTDKDTGYYWCAVEIDGGSDAGKYFQLSVTRGLYVDHQEIRAVKEGRMTVNCHYHNIGEIKWCKMGSSCVTGSAGSIDEASVTINATVSNVFTVTMSGLRIESSGWYWCVKGDLQMPVHVAVNEQSTTTNKAPTTAQGEQRRVPFHLQSIIISLSLLVFIVMVALFIWFMLRRHKQTKAESATTVPEEEVTYSDIKHERKTPSKTPDAQSDVDVVYSSVVVTEQQNARSVHS